MTLRRWLSPALFVVIAMALVLPGAASAQQQQQVMSFTLSSRGSELETVATGRYRLTLTSVSPVVTTIFGTPPSLSRRAESVSTFVDSWSARQFEAQPPIGAFTGDKTMLTFRLSKPVWERSGGTLTFDAVPTSTMPVDVPGKFGPTFLAVASKAVAAPDSSPSVFTRIRDFGTEWSGVLGLLFMFAIVGLLWRSLKLMPKTKPQTLKPAARSSVAWEQIAGADDAKDELMEVVQFLRDPKKFRRYGANMPKGVLLHGPPGTGKTLLAKAVAHESGAHFFSQSAASFVEMFAGLGAARIRRLFAEARKHSPAIIFIDELDAVGGKRGNGSENSEREQTLNQLLVEMDGFAATEDVVVMAASNLLDKLDPALLRPGRFDRQVFVSPPDVAGRAEILRVHTTGKPIHEVDLQTIAAQTSGLTGADLANLCNEAAIFCARRDGVAITQADFDLALERVIAGVQSKRVLQPSEKSVVAYHEAGHALCGEMLPSVDKVHKVSIVPRGKALGFVLNLPEEDRYLKTRDELLDHMAMLLGGRVAEQVVFGKITTGASDDLRRVSELTYAMVHEYAMGTADSAQRALQENHLASDTTRRIRDEEQRELAYEAQAMAERLITEHRDKLEELAQQLLTHEVLERPQIDAIMKGTAPVTDRPRLTGTPLVTAMEEDESPGA
ncbi:MAG: AAA family ATPase [Solirubrobacteraceae bacterium]|nr:AAA family ATPase [Solirubrobacteraceae bacterium]